MAQEYNKITCKKDNHEDNVLQYVCYNESCQEDRFCCCHCLVEHHADHIHDKIPLSQFWSTFKGKFQDRFRRIEDINQQIKIVNDKDKISHFKQSIIQQLDNLKDTICQQVEKFKQEIPGYVKFTGELDRLSNLYEGFNKIRQTATINQVFFDAQAIKYQEPRIKECIDIYFDKGFSQEVDHTVEEIRNYQLSLDELRKQNEYNLKIIDETNVKLQVKLICVKNGDYYILNQFFKKLSLEEQFQQLGYLFKSSVEKVLQFTANQNRLGFESVTSSLLEIENNVAPNRVSTIKFKQDLLMSPSIKDRNSHLIQQHKQQGIIALERKFLKKDKNGHLCAVCQHYVSNYIPIYKCCTKQYSCYICHDAQENHKHLHVQGALCLKCKTISTDFGKCTGCNKKFSMVQ